MRFRFKSRFSHGCARPIGVVAGLLFLARREPRSRRAAAAALVFGSRSWARGLGLSVLPPSLPRLSLGLGLVQLARPVPERVRPHGHVRAEFCMNCGVPVAGRR